MTPVPLDILRVVAAWAAFALFHSLTVSDGYGRLALRAMGERAFAAWHRLAFTGYSCLAFLLLLLYLRTVPDAALYRLEGWPHLLCRIVQGAGAAFLFWTPWDLAEFVGLSQWRRRNDPVSPGRNERLFTGKAYGVVRHPLYLGISVILAASPVQSRNSFVSSAMAILYFYVGTFLEERRLERVFGEEYSAYRKRVPRFLPIGWVFSWRRALRP